MKNIFKLFTFCLVLVLSSWKVSAQSGTITFTLANPVCNNDGILIAQTTGLTPPITFYWWTAGVQTTHTVTNSFDTLFNYAGGYVYLNALGTGGQAYGNFAGAPPFTYVVTTSPAICPALGTAAVTITGGTAPYNIQWSEIPSGTVVGSGANVNLPAGNYSVLITDAAGCVSGTYAVGDSIYIWNQSPVTFTTTSTPANCTNGTATVSGLGGGIAPYSFIWSNGSNSQTITGLSLGYYQVTVTDAQGCYQTEGIYVQQSITIGTNVTLTPATCLQNDGSAISFGSGGLPPYSYHWSNGINTQNISNLTAGNYSITVIDANGCVGEGYYYLSSSTPITVTYSSTPSQCTSATGTATLVATGGTAPYTYQWNTFPAQTGATATGLEPGTYSFIVTDNVGCIRSGTVVVPPISVVSGFTNSADAYCTLSNGSAQIIITSGTAPYTTAWSNGGNTTSITNLAAGGYTCTVTDNLGCSIVKYAVVQASSPISIGFASTPASCIYTADGNIVAIPYGGTAPYTYAWSNGQTTNIASSLITGNYYVYVTDAAGCVQNSWTSCGYDPLNNSCYCTIEGTVYDDANGNCTMDAGENGIENIMIHCSGFGYTYTNASGHYSFQVPTGSYTLSENVQYFYPLAACQNNSISVSVSAASGCSNTYDFANVINPIHDIHISTLHYTPPIPGHTYYQHVIIKNEGTINETDVVSGYKHDGQMNLSSFSPFAQLNAGSFPSWYSIASTGQTLAPAQSNLSIANYNVPTNIPLGTSLLFNDTCSYNGLINNWLSDYSPWNNVNTYYASVVGSWDPNFKEVRPKGTGVPGYISVNDSILEYTIHFQNTGTYTAFNIYLLDTLDSDLDYTSLHPVYSSHNFKAEMTENGVIKFSFENINLPDSLNDPLGSIGYIIYTIKQNPNLTPGTQIKNSASIYFDYNAPVKTNTTLNTIQQDISTHDMIKSEFDFSIYPNPSNNEVSIMVNAGNGSSNGSLKVMDILGKTYITQQLSLKNGNNLYGIDVRTLPAGIYFVEVSDGTNSYVKKMTVVK